MKQFIAFVRKILPYLPRQANHADIAGYACGADYPFRLCHNHGSEECPCRHSRPVERCCHRCIIDRLDASEYFSVTTNLNTRTRLRSLSDGETLIWQSSSASNLRITFIPEMLVYSWWPMLPTPIQQPHRPVMPPTSYPLPEAKCFRREYRFPLLFPK